jgi:16S rRNA processing protein RimM
MSKNILIAKIISARGIQGEVKIMYFGDDVKNLEKYQIFDAKNNHFNIKLLNKSAIASNASGDKIVVAKIDGVVDRNQAELLRGTELFTDRKNFSKTKKNEFYIADLLGLKVFNLHQQEIGKIINVFNRGLSTAIEIEFLDNFIPAGFQKIDNFPFKNDFFPQVDVESGNVVFEAPELV